MIARRRDGVPARAEDGLGQQSVRRPTTGRSRHGRNRTGLAIASLAFSVLILAGCTGGRSSPSPSPTAEASPDATSPRPTPTAAADSPVATPTVAEDPDRQLLQQMVLNVEDLPPGFTELGASFSTNQDVAEVKPDPQQELARLDEAGRILGYDVTYSPGPDSPAGGSDVRAVNTTASLYTTPEGASSSWQEGVNTARTQDWPASYPNIADVEVREMPAAGLADQALWIRVSGAQDASSLYIEDFVLLRRDRARAFLRVVIVAETSLGKDAHRDDVTDWIVRQVERVDAALQSQG